MKIKGNPLTPESQQQSSPANEKADELLHSELDRRLAPSISAGIVDVEGLKWAQTVGLADVEEHRPANPASIYAIGSVTKVFTATLLMILNQEGRIDLNTPAGSFLRSGSLGPLDPSATPPISVLDLATHTSGLPRDPPCASDAGDDPYHGFSEADLYRVIRELPPVVERGIVQYSNLGFGILGHIVERVRGMPWEQALSRFILEPLAMHSTSLDSSSPVLATECTTGYAGETGQRRVPPWNFGALAACGALWSNLEDMARFLRANLVVCNRPDPAFALSCASARRMWSPRPHVRSQERWKQGIGWLVTNDLELGTRLWHNGGVGGHSSYVGFLPNQAIAVIVLLNRAEVYGRAEELGVELLNIWLKSGSDK
jgi:CubicO group peptidase (beta-lactamase class C family)